MIEEKNILLRKAAQKIFEEATAASLGTTFHMIISFHLKKKFGKDPYEILIDEPRIFYDGLEEVLGTGADAVISLVGTFLIKQYGANCTPEELITLFIKGDASSKRQLSEIFSKTYTHTGKLAK